MDTFGMLEKIYYTIIFVLFGFGALTILSMLVSLPILWIFGVRLTEFSWFIPVICTSRVSLGIVLILLPFSLFFDEDEFF